MKKFNRDGGFGDRRGGGRDFNRRDSRGGGFGRGGDGGRPEMHKATCAECGNSCEVPFRPTGDKPVYCSNCFKNKGGSDMKKSGGRDFDRRGGFDDRRGGFDDKKMFKAICDECGNSCEVPFQPSSGKPVYCSECFGKSDNPKNKSNKNSGGGDFEALNAKLDKIIWALDSLLGSKTGKEKEAVKEVKKVEKTGKVAEVKVAAPKKEVKKVGKKVAAPKAVAKKKAKK